MDILRPATSKLPELGLSLLPILEELVIKMADIYYEMLKISRATIDSRCRTPVTARDHRNAGFRRLLVLASSNTGGVG